MRGQLIAALEGAAKDLTALLETGRESDGDRAPVQGVWVLHSRGFQAQAERHPGSDPGATGRSPGAQEHEWLPPIQVSASGY